MGRAPRSLSKERAGVELLRLVTKTMSGRSVIPAPQHDIDLSVIPSVGKTDSVNLLDIGGGEIGFYHYSFAGGFLQVRCGEKMQMALPSQTSGSKILGLFDVLTSSEAS